MAKKTKKKETNNKSNTSKNKINSSVKLTDYLAYLPGLLMVGMVALVLLLDIMSPKMQETHYEDFRNIFRVFDYMAITGGSIFLVIAVVKKKLKLCLRDCFFIAFMACIVISTCINGLSHDAAFGIPMRYIGIFNMFAFFIIYMKVSGFIERASFRHTVLTGYLIVSDAMALTMTYELYFGDIPSYQSKSGVSAIFVNSNHYGYFLAMAIMIGIGYYLYEDRNKSFFGAASALVNLYILILNKTLGAMLAVGICTAMTVILVLVSEMKSGNITARTLEHKVRPKTAKRTLMLAIIGVAALIVATTASAGLRYSIASLFHDMGSIIAGTSTGNEGSGRWNLWRTVAHYITEKPLFGYGCEGISRRLREATGIGDAHCEPLTYAAYYGIPGALLYLAGVTAAAVRFFKERRNLPSHCRIAFLGASAYFISSLVGVSMFNTAPFFFIFMGMSSEEWKEQ